jgi:tetratricopeptide (TPR) repeat protein
MGQHKRKSDAKPLPPRIVIGSWRRRWAFRLGIMILAPLLLLGGLEAALRLGGFGYPTSFFLTVWRGGQKLLIENARFGWRFVSPTLARTPQPVTLPAVKPPGTCRIFVLGESAAMGDPEPAYGFPRMLQVLLEARYPDTHFEVVNVAMTAINSHVILPIARECAHRQGDIWVVYMGNNEVVGPYGPGTVFGTRSANLAWLRASLALKRTRIGQLLETARSRWGSEKNSPQWQGMEMFLEQQVASDDPRLEGVCRNFQRNLEDILKAGIKGGAKIIVSTVASNLKDCAPFGSMHSAGLSPANLNEWDQLSQAGFRLVAARDFAGAFTVLSQAVQLDPAYAEIHYRLGECQWALERYAEAEREFAKARDLDTLRFRTDTRLNDIIRKAAADRVGVGIYLFDACAMFAGQSPHGVTGDEFFYEHVHLNQAGNYLLARGVADQVANVLPLGKANGTAPEWLSVDECANRLALTAWNRQRILEELAERLRRPPFAQQLHHEERDQRLRQALAKDTTVSEPGSRSRYSALYQQAIERAPSDWVLHSQYAKMLEALGDTSGAEREFSKVVEWVPQHAVAQYYLGRLLNRGQDRRPAMEHLQAALRLIPHFAEAHNSMGIALAHLGKYESAYREYAMALQYKPGLADAQVDWGLTLASQGKAPEAMAHYQAALVINSNSAPAHLCLARLLVQQDKGREAFAHFVAAFRLQRDSAEQNCQLGKEASAQNKSLEALARYLRAVELRPDLAEARHNLGIELGHQGRWREARTQLLEAVRLQPGSATAHFDLGVAYARESQFAEAAAQFRETLRLQPENENAKKFLQNAQTLLARQQPASGKGP